MYPSVNNGIAGIPENRLGFVGEATYLPHLHIGAIRKGRPFFWQFLNTPGTSKQRLQRLSERCGDPDLSGANGMHFKFIFHRGETHFFSVHPYRRSRKGRRGRPPVYWGSTWPLISG